MEINLRNIVLFGSVVTTALSAGLFYAWVVSVIPGTRKISDHAYLQTMQSINREIINPWFFIIFFGPLFLLILSSFLQFKLEVNSIFYLILSATLIYSIGTIGITLFGNVPLNNVVEALDLSSLSPEEFRNAREAYESRWNNLNLLRTIAALISFVLVLITFVKG